MWSGLTQFCGSTGPGNPARAATRAESRVCCHGCCCGQWSNCQWCGGSSRGAAVTPELPATRAATENNAVISRAGRRCPRRTSVRCMPPPWCGTTHAIDRRRLDADARTRCQLTESPALTAPRLLGGPPACTWSVDRAEPGWTAVAFDGVDGGLPDPQHHRAAGP